MKRFLPIAACVIAVLCAACALGAAPGGKDAMEITSMDLTPDTIAEKVAMSDFVVVGRVLRVEDVGGGTKGMTQMITDAAAVIQVTRVLKGVLGDDEIRVAFKKSSLGSRPARTTLEPGETAVLFLAPEAGGGFRFITPYAGKAPAEAAREVEAIVKDTGGGGGVAARVAPAFSAFASGAPAPVEMRLTNTGGAPVTLYTLIDPERDLVIVREDGTAVPPKRKLTDRPKLRREYFTTLQPGQFIGATVDIAALFDISGPGAYSVVFSIRCPSGKELGLVSFSGALSSSTAQFSVGAAGGGK